MISGKLSSKISMFGRIDVEMGFITSKLIFPWVQIKKSANSILSLPMIY